MAAAALYFPSLRASAAVSLAWLCAVLDDLTDFTVPGAFSAGLFDGLDALDQEGNEFFALIAPGQQIPFTRHMNDLDGVYLPFRSLSLVGLFVLDEELLLFHHGLGKLVELL